MQINSFGDEIPIAFTSRTLNKCQCSYSVTEKECLAAIMSTKKFRAYVEGHDFTVVTDHASLKWLMSQSDLSCRLARWDLKLQGYSFKIQHRKGTQNVVPDALSRTFTEDLSALNVEHFIDLDSEHFNSEEYEKLKAKAVENRSHLPDVKVIDKFVYRRSEHAPGEKLAPTFLKARIRRKLGNCYYELEDLQGRPVGKFHAKDIKQ
ncbi:uncharacterized protein LOC118756607 [Rhagoletis pomonella]|uniref:uncharacterized protein LOC118756607 n=1 Tax=Rhagoletis pomonella TaxID=28610 RepID=UPI00177A9FEF|nr:uncharacterized protein LOC118756607 [Rhagoletis pomonella]